MVEELDKFTHFFGPYPSINKAVKKQDFNNIIEKYQLQNFVNYENKQVNDENHFIHEIIHIIIDNKTTEKESKEIEDLQNMLLAYLSHKLCRSLAKEYFHKYPAIRNNIREEDVYQEISNALCEEVVQSARLERNPYQPQTGSFINYVLKGINFKFQLNKYFSRRYNIEIGQTSNVGVFKKGISKKALNKMLSADDDSADDDLISLYYKTIEYVEYNTTTKTRNLDDVDWTELVNRTNFSSIEELRGKLDLIVKSYKEYVNQKFDSLHAPEYDNEGEGKEKIDSVEQPGTESPSNQIIINEAAKQELNRFIDENLNEDLREEDLREKDRRFRQNYYQYYLATLFKLERNKSPRQNILSCIFRKDQGTIARSENPFRDRCLFHLLSTDNLPKPEQFEQYYKVLQDDDEEKQKYHHNVVNNKIINHDSLTSNLFCKNTDYNKRSLKIIEETFFKNLEAVVSNNKQKINKQIELATKKIMTDLIHKNEIKVDEPDFLNKISKLVKEIYELLKARIHRRLDDDILDELFYERAYKETYSFYHEKIKEQNFNIDTLDREKLRTKLFEFLESKITYLEGSLDNLESNYINDLEQRLYQDFIKENS
jgi:hypothetical protein